MTTTNIFKLNIEPKEYYFIISECFGLDIQSVWFCADDDERELSFESKKILFCSLIYHMMKDGVLKLANDGKFLEGTPEEQVITYYKSFPNEQEMDDDFFWITKENRYWIPAGAVWIKKDGAEVWT